MFPPLSRRCVVADDFWRWLLRVINAAAAAAIIIMTSHITLLCVVQNEGIWIRIRIRDLAY